MTNRIISNITITPPPPIQISAFWSCLVHAVLSNTTRRPPPQNYDETMREENRNILPRPIRGAQKQYPLRLFYLENLSKAPD